MRLVTAAASLLTRLVKLGLLAALLVGIPTGLSTQIGWPLPSRIPTLDDLSRAVTAPLTDTAVLKFLAIVLWMLWAAFTASLLVEIAATIAGTPAPRLAFISPLQPLTAWLVAGLTASMLAPAVPAAAAHPSNPPGRIAATVSVDRTTRTPPASAAAHRGAHPAATTRHPTTHPTGASPTISGHAGTDNQHRSDASRQPAAGEHGGPNGPTGTAHRVSGAAGSPTTSAPAPTPPARVPATPAEPSQSSPSAPPAPAHTSAGTAIQPDGHRGGDNPAPRPADAPVRIHRVVDGDTLWDISAQELGDPLRWREIYVLNRGRRQADGHTLSHPDEIRVGWLLVLPAAAPPATFANAPAPPDPSSPTPRLSRPPVPANPPTPTPTPTPTTASTPTPAATDVVPARPAGTPGQDPAERGAGPPLRDASSTPAPSRHKSASNQRPLHGVGLPSHGWISLGLAATIAALTGLLRLQQRRRARLTFPIPLRTGPTPAPVPDSLYRADAAGSRVLTARTGGPLPDLVPDSPRAPAPIGVNEQGDEISLFDVPGSALALDGHGAPAAARAIIAAVLATAVTDHAPTRPILVIPADTLTRLLPDDTSRRGLDPNHETFDGERLTVVADTAAAVTHLETEMIHRRRLLDDMGVDSADELNARTDHGEHLAPYVLLVPADPRYPARILAVAAHRHTLHLHPVLLGALPDTPNVAHLHVAADGTFTTTATGTAAGAEEPAGGPLPRHGRLAVLSARDLADLLGMLAAVAPRPETGLHAADPTPEPRPDRPSHGVDLTEIPARTTQVGTPAPVRLSVLGPPTLATADAPISSGVRRGSLAVLAVLAAHPRGRTFEELAADLHPDADPETAINRVRTDLNAVRSLLREATGIQGRGKFILYDSASSRYRIDPELIEVDLWRMLSAIDRANKAGDDEKACLAALREAVACHQGDFAEGHDRAWVIDYATTYRHQLLGAYARIAEILEVDQPDHAIAALQAAIERDPVNEELYQRLMRIHGRLGRQDAVRRTLRLLENRLAELDEAEPSEGTRRVAARQLKPALTSHG